MNKQQRAHDADRFAKVQGSPGQQARFLGWFRFVWPAVLFAFFAGYLVRTAYPFPPLGQSAAGALLLGACLLFALAFAWGEGRLRNYLKGVRGEELVARILNFLPASWSVFHSVTLGRQTPLWRDYDHVAIGPSGVFVIETKNWSGSIKVENGEIFYNGTRPDRSPVHQVQQSSHELGKYLTASTGLDVHVQPVVCFAGGGLPVPVVKSGNVTICTPPMLSAVLESAEKTTISEKQKSMIGQCVASLISGTSRQET